MSVFTTGKASLQDGEAPHVKDALWTVYSTWEHSEESTVQVNGKSTFQTKFNTYIRQNHNSEMLSELDELLRHPELNFISCQE